MVIELCAAKYSIPPSVDTAAPSTSHSTRRRSSCVPASNCAHRLAPTTTVDAIPAATRLHVLGFARADEIASFTQYGITSFDTASPMIRSFKDASKNYYLPNGDGTLRYYTAIRVPQALENNKLMGLVKQGALRQEELVTLEKAALGALRRYDKDKAGIEETLEAVLAYAVPATLGAPLNRLPGSKSVGSLRERYYRTLVDRLWTQCACGVCRALSVEVMIFRASNRNKRRGMHNMTVFDGLVDGLDLKGKDNVDPSLFGDPRTPERSAHGPLFCGESV